MPTPVVMMPPINHMETSMEVQPWMVLPWKYSTKAKIIMMTATKVIAKPRKVINLRGATENEVMPSILKLSILVNGYLLSPASRALRS